MHLKKKATVLISTVIILSLMIMLGCFLYKMMRNNIELGALCKYDKDIYDFDKDEEEILYQFMERLNKSRADKLSNQTKENNNEEEDIFSKGFEKIGDSVLEYDKNNGKYFLTTNKDKGNNRKREIKYTDTKEKIILVPTYKFEINSNKNK